MAPGPTTCLHSQHRGEGLDSETALRPTKFFATPLQSQTAEKTSMAWPKSLSSQRWSHQARHLLSWGCGNKGIFLGWIGGKRTSTASADDQSLVGREIPGFYVCHWQDRGWKAGKWWVRKCVHPPGPLGHETCGLKNRSWFGNASLVHTRLVERICITGCCPCFFAGNPTLDLVRSLSFRTTIWVCTFANNQFGEAFGATILQTPFVKAVEMAEATILMVDRDAGSALHTGGQHERKKIALLDVYLLD